MKRERNDTLVRLVVGTFGTGLGIVGVVKAAAGSATALIVTGAVLILAAYLGPRLTEMSLEFKDLKAQISMTKEEAKEVRTELAEAREILGVMRGMTGYADMSGEARMTLKEIARVSDDRSRIDFIIYGEGVEFGTDDLVVKLYAPDGALLLEATAPQDAAMGGRRSWQAAYTSGPGRTVPDGRYKYEWRTSDSSASVVKTGAIVLSPDGQQGGMPTLDEFWQSG